MKNNVCFMQKQFKSYLFHYDQMDEYVHHIFLALEFDPTLSSLSHENLSSHCLHCSNTWNRSGKWKKKKKIEFSAVIVDDTQICQ